MLMYNHFDILFSNSRGKLFVLFSTSWFWRTNNSSGYQSPHHDGFHAAFCWDHAACFWCGANNQCLLRHCHVCGKVLPIKCLFASMVNWVSTWSPTFLSVYIPNYPPYLFINLNIHTRVHTPSFLTFQLSKEQLHMYESHFESNL